MRKIYIGGREERIKILSLIEILKIWILNWWENQMTRATQYLNGNTEFGSGFVLCLIKFAEHAERFDRVNDETAQQMIINNWFYDVGDHLAKLEIPQCFKGTKIETLTKELKSLCVAFHAGGCTEEDVDKAVHIVRLIAMEIDKFLGLKADIGKH